MIRIRLRRTGSRNQACYRVVVADKESPRDGRFIEILGNYNPRTQPATVELKEERVFYWLSVGAQPTESVEKIFKSIKFDERYAAFKAGKATTAPAVETEPQA